MDRTWHWCENLTDVIDFMALVSSAAPDRFPTEEDPTLCLDVAFDELRRGLKVSEKQIRDPEVIKRGYEIFDKAYEHYKADHIREGNDLMVEFQYELRALRSGRRT